MANALPGRAQRSQSGRHLSGISVNAACVKALDLLRSYYGSAAAAAAALVQEDAAADSDDEQPTAPQSHSEAFAFIYLLRAFQTTSTRFFR